MIFEDYHKTDSPLLTIINHWLSLVVQHVLVHHLQFSIQATNKMFIDGLMVSHIGQHIPTLRKPIGYIVSSLINHCQPIANMYCDRRQPMAMHTINIFALPVPPTDHNHCQPTIEPSKFVMINQCQPTLVIHLNHYQPIVIVIINHHTPQQSKMVTKSSKMTDP